MYLFVFSFMVWYFNIMRIEKDTYDYMFGNELTEFCKTKGLNYYYGSVSIKNTTQYVSRCEEEKIKYLLLDGERVGIVPSETERIICKRFQVN